MTGVVKARAIVLGSTHCRRKALVIVEAETADGRSLRVEQEFGHDTNAQSFAERVNSILFGLGLR